MPKGGADPGAFAIVIDASITMAVTAGNTSAPALTIAKQSAERVRTGLCGG